MIVCVRVCVCVLSHHFRDCKIYHSDELSIDVMGHKR